MHESVFHVPLVTRTHSRFCVMVWWRQVGVWFAMMMRVVGGAMAGRNADVVVSVPPQAENGQQRATRRRERGVAFTAFVAEKKNNLRVRRPWTGRSSKKEQHQGFPRGPPP